jgi:hypothetical protein
MSIAVSVLVTDGITDPAPELLGLSSSIGFAGESVTLHGFGLGTEGHVYLNDRELSVQSYSQTEVKAIIGEGCVSGYITVERSGIRSNGLMYYVKTKSFNLYTDISEVRMQKNEEQDVSLFVAGTCGEVTLTASADAPFLTTILSTDSVIPNAKIIVSIKAGDQTVSGSYTVTVTGTCDNLIVTKKITITIRNPFSIVSTSLIIGRERVPYKATLKSENGSEPVRFVVTEGSLPDGIILKETGVLEGVPLEAGHYGFEVQATDTFGRTAVAQFTLIIAENGWGHDAGNAARTRYNPISVPAEKRIQWTSILNLAGASILTSQDRVFAVGKDRIICLDRDMGREIYRIEKQVSKAACSGNTLCVLDGNHTLSLFDGEIGTAKTILENVSWFIIEDNVLYINRNDQLVKIIVSADNSNITEESLGTLPVPVLSDSLVSLHDGRFLVAGTGSLRLLSSNGWQIIELAGKPETTAPVALASDSSGAVVLFGNGTLIRLSTDLKQSGIIETGIVDGRLAMDEKRIILYNSSSVKCLSRIDGRIIFQASTGFTDAALGMEKLIGADKRRLEVVNVFTGNTIWQTEGDYTDIAVSQDKLYASTRSGDVTSFTGNPNISCPQTELILSPPLPDGANGYYITHPKLSLTASDRETYVRETFYRTANSGYSLYTGNIVVGDGEQTYYAFSIDSDGMAEPEKSISIKVDSIPPVTSCTLRGVEGTNNYYIGSVSVSLASIDSGSGVEKIEYQVNHSGWRIYNDPVKLSKEGHYSIRYRARDRAGNIEAIKTIPVSIDLKNPIVRPQKRNEPGLAVLYLYAKDDFSKISRIEYQIDDGAILDYIDPIALTSGGKHEIRYRAVDNAGRSSDWRTLQVMVAPFNKGEWIHEIVSGENL